MKIEDLLQGYSAPKYFILDSHQNAMNEQEAGHRYDDSDYIGYGYNIHQFNQLVPGAFFLYRRPGKLSPDKKFHIYGGGIIDSISSPDPQGNVIAKIKLGYELNTIINQGDHFIETFIWTTRKKPGPGWKGFWINYGMNEITSTDFFNLISGRTCTLSGNQLSGIQTIEENEDITDPQFGGGFEITVDDNTSIPKSTPKPATAIVKNIDFTLLNKRKKTIGTAGELIVLEYENEKLNKIGASKRAEHVADLIGDGLGYDIKSYDYDGSELHIEVKTTKSNMSDNFFMSRREIEESQNPNFKYKIYRVYNYNSSAKTANLKIYDGAITSKDYDMEPTSYRIKHK